MNSIFIFHIKKEINERRNKFWDLWNERSIYIKFICLYLVYKKKKSRGMKPFPIAIFYFFCTVVIIVISRIQMPIILTFPVFINQLLCIAFLYLFENAQFQASSKLFWRSLFFKKKKSSWFFSWPCRHPKGICLCNWQKVRFSQLRTISAFFSLVFLSLCYIYNLQKWNWYRIIIL